MCVLIIFPDQIYFKVTLISLVVSICFSSPLHPLRHSFRCIVKCGSRYKHCRETSTKSHCHITTGQTKQLCYNKTTDMSLQGDNVLHWLNNTQRSCRTMMYGMQPFKMYIVYSSNTLYTVPIHCIQFQYIVYSSNTFATFSIHSSVVNEVYILFGKPDACQARLVYCY